LGRLHPDTAGRKPVQTGALELLEPAPRGVQAAGDRGDVDRRTSVGQHPLQLLPPLGQRTLAQVDVAEGEQVEGDEAGRGLLGQQPHPAIGRVDARPERLEVQPVAGRDPGVA
jgi:hypothetical protein